MSWGLNSGEANEKEFFLFSPIEERKRECDEVRATEFRVVVIVLYLN